MPDSPDKKEMSFEMEDEPGLEPVAESFLTKHFGDVPFQMREVIVDGPDDGIGLEIGDEGELLFDGKKLDAFELDVIDRMIGEIDSGKIRDSKNSRFEWFFREENDEFLSELKGVLEQRRSDLSEGDPMTGILTNTDLKPGIKQAAEFMRDAAMKEMIRKTVKEQIGDMPFSKVLVEDMGGSEEWVDFDAETFDDHFDFIYVKTDSGPELLITHKDPSKQLTGFELKEDSYGKGFKLEEDGTRKRYDEDEDLKHWEVVLGSGEGGKKPIFNTVRVMRDHVNIDAIIDDLVREREELEERKRAQEQAAYTPPPPRYTPPQRSSSNYVRSG